ncbi:MAG: hypothetical protein A3J83_03610 [Elusimicrobia bacterium RIFOXYA2_FULL_40_6]|nr:MAG: hypothetical protein A3J83_03610 [Elusimicrobia bacterium RIFOXYA2_FULL_40_6]
MTTKKKVKTVAVTQKKKEIKTVKTKSGTKPYPKAATPKKTSVKPAKKPCVSDTNASTEQLQRGGDGKPIETNKGISPTKQENGHPKDLKPSKTMHIQAMDTILLDGAMHSRDEIVEYVLENSPVVGDDLDAWKKKLRILTYVRYFTLKNKGLNMLKEGDKIGLSKDAGAVANSKEHSALQAEQDPPATTEPADNQ